MTYTTAILPIPRAAWDYICEAMEQAGHSHLIVDAGPGIGNTVAFDMTDIMVVPMGDSDQFINSGRLSDLMVQSNEESFYAGFNAAKKGEPMGRAWSDYEPSDDILELQNNL